jgi:hypothetical protein
VAERVSRGVQHLPVVPADAELLAAAQPLRGLDHRVQVGHPPGQVVGQVGPFHLGHPVVGVGVQPARPRGVRVPVLLAVEVGEGVHGQPRAGELHQPPGQAVVVDVGVRDEDPGDVAQREPGPLQAGLQGGQAAVRPVRQPHPAVHDRHPVAVRDDVAVDALDRVHADRQRNPGDVAGRGPGRLHPCRGGHPCMRSSSVNHTRSSTR